MQLKDIPDEAVVELAQAWRDRRGPGVVEALMLRYGIPHKLALVKVESLCARKHGRAPLLEYGTSPHYAWPA